MWCAMPPHLYVVPATAHAKRGLAEFDARPRRSLAIRASGCALQMMETPLSRAAHNAHIHTVRHLLEQGADVDCLDLVRLDIRLFILTGGIIRFQTQYWPAF